jgi:hypothetical protein
MHPKQIEIYHKMSPAQKLAIAIQLREDAWELKAAWLRQLHTDWSEEEVQNKVREIFLYART